MSSSELLSNFDSRFGSRSITAESLGQIKDTKTHDERVVDMSLDLARILRDHLAWLRTETLKRGWGEAEWLFPNEVGRPMDEAKVSRIFRLVIKRAGLPSFRLYDLRHTFASLLLAAGAPLTYVAAQLGHANPTTTLRFYARWIPSRGQRWVEMLDRSHSRATVERLLADLEPKVEPNRAATSGGEAEVIDSEWSRGRESNPRPTDYESVALPLSYPGVPLRSLPLGRSARRLLCRWFQHLVPQPARSWRFRRGDDRGRGARTSQSC